MTEPTPASPAPRRWPFAWVKDWLTSSLPVRIAALMVAASIFVLGLGGVMLHNQTTEGILEGKKQSSIATASAALSRMQLSVMTTSTRDESFYDKLNRLADEAAAQANQYLVVIEGPVSGFVSGGVLTASVPPQLRETVRAGDGLYEAPTLVQYSSPDQPSEPGIVVGGKLQAAGQALEAPVYFIFPLTRENEILSVVRGAELTTGAILLLALGLLALAVARQVTVPVREASEVAGRLATGDFSERMPVRGTDDLASLGTSMNRMADGLERQFGQLQELSRVQTQFVSDVSHELRTPLTTVRMAAEVLHESRDGMDPVASRSAELLHDEVERFENLLNDLLEISRFGAGAAVLSAEDIDLVQLVGQECDRVRGFADRAGSELRVVAPRPVDADVDQRRIRRIVRNLLTNAIEHGEGGPIDVTVRGNSSTAAIGVRDHGVGLAPHEIGHVFDRFWRADPSRARTLGGSGLGLSISLEDAHLHGGSLEAWGRRGQGANFVLTLPKRQHVPMAGHPIPLEPVDATPSGRPLEARPALLELEAKPR